MASFGRFDPTYVKGFQGNVDGISVDDMKDIDCIDVSLLYKLLKVIPFFAFYIFLNSVYNNIAVVTVVQFL